MEMKRFLLIPCLVAFLFTFVEISQGLPREIKYADKWSSETFHHNDLFDETESAVDYNEVPLAVLKSDDDKIVVFKKRPNKKEPNQAQPLTIGFLLNLLFGGLGNRPLAGSMTTVKPPHKTTTINPIDATLINRTRRPTKYKPKGNCKNPPKKHEKEDETDDSE